MLREIIILPTSICMCKCIIMSCVKQLGIEIMASFFFSTIVFSQNIAIVQLKECMERLLVERNITKLLKAIIL